MDLKAAGLDSGNYWFYDHADLDSLYAQGLVEAERALLTQLAEKIAASMTLPAEPG